MGPQLFRKKTKTNKKQDIFRKIMENCPLDELQILSFKDWDSQVLFDLQQQYFCVITLDLTSIIISFINWLFIITCDAC